MLSVDEQMRVITSGAAQIVPEADLRKKLEKGEPLNIKLGVDPTSPDLHLGHAVPLRKMRQFQDLGHNVTLIIGNGTALIGDPSGKNSTRPQLSQEQIEANAETYVSQAMKILDPEKTTIVHNGDWILSMDLAGLLQVCSKFTVARILERDDFTKRYQSQTPIALHEFLYPVMQAFDSVQIKADVEMGGTDQLFNLLAGRELMEKMGMEPQIALTMPLLEGTDGVRKMSKSYGNYIGLTDAPKDMFGKTMSIPDEMIGKYYRLASSLTPAEVDKIDAALADGSADPYELKRALGRDLCDTYHGAGAVVGVAQVAAQSALELIGIGRAVGQSSVDLVDLGRGERAGQTIVLADHLVGDGHGLAEHVLGRVGQADVVTVGLGHLTNAIGALEQRHGERDLGLHAHLLHELTAGEQVEKLIGAAHLHVGLDLHGVESLHHGIQELMQGDRRLRLVALGKVIALKNAGDGELGAHLQQTGQIHRKDPVAVVHDGGLLGIQDLHGLAHIGLGIGLDLLLRKLRTRGVLARGVADQRGTVADDEGDVVAQVLELTHLAQGHGVAQVQVGAGGVDAELDVEGLALLKLLAKVGLGDDLGSTRGDDTHLLVNRQHWVSSFCYSTLAENGGAGSP